MIRMIEKTCLGGSELAMTLADLLWGEGIAKTNSTALKLLLVNNLISHEIDEA
ncbi:hypothetical protein [Sporosarcina sp. NPDC096371]|uniref:hypothetical protein n=1 Tax=Sporosarcina sp. NPDC096371 TaxID=3364530 RepID=UPI00380AD377